MERENVVAVVGLVGLAAVGAVLMLTTTGRPANPVKTGPAERPVKAAKAAKSPVELVTRGEVGERPAAPEGAANVVFVVGCTVRRDAIGAYGGPEGLTPRLDALAARGARFDDAVAAAVWTRESFAALSTGRHAAEVGLVEPGPKASARRLAESHLTVAEALQARGWWTVGVNASPGITQPVSGLWQGVDHLRDAHPDGWKGDHRLGAPGAASLATQMLAERPPDRPFFLQLVLTDAHKQVRVTPEESAPWTEAGLPNAPYHAAVHRLDGAVGVLVDWLDAQGLSDRTYVVFVADHGEGLDRPPHHGPAHGRLVAPSVAGVPWIVAGPGVPAGGVVGGLASGVDVGPTLLGLLGLAGALDPEASGLDLSGAVRGAPSPARAEAITDTWYMTANRAAIWTSDRQCQRDFGSEALEGETFADACFDRRADPDHRTPIDDAALMARLVAWRGARPVTERAP